MFYLDTSVIVTALTIENRTAEIQQWFLGHQSEAMAVSDWTVAEFSSAISIKVRSGQLDQNDRSKVHALFDELCSASFTLLPIIRMDFSDAATLAARLETGIRAGDALHLAVVNRNDVTLVTLDKGMANACTLFGTRHQLL